MMHGIHVHQFGDIGNSCMNAGPHYNPTGMVHGNAVNNPRHVGDLGNIMANAAGVATIDRLFSATSLSPPFSILGRGLVVHAMRDDLGQGNAPDSSTTGNSGARVGCGVIGVIEDQCP